jgi:peptide/nickel transport system permease protein
MRTVWKQPLFLTGLTFLVLMLTASFGYTVFFDDKIRQMFYLREGGRLIDGSPLPPMWKFPLGTDSLGFDMLGKILIGAKYTILAAIAVAALRVFIAIPFGFLLGTLFRKQKKYVNGLIDSFHYVPLTIIAFYILRPILMEPVEGFQTSFFERLVIEVVILAVLTVPIIVSLIGNETSLLYKQEYILGAKTLGASNFRIIRKHIYPAMREKLFVVFGQQVMQTLIILSHLGLLHLFLGGTHINYSRVPDPPTSLSNEWSGLIGDSFRYLETAPWLPLAPILCFAATMLAVALMIEGYVRATSGRSHYFKRSKEMKEYKKDKLDYKPNQEDFKQLKRIG